MKWMECEMENESTGLARASDPATSASAAREASVRLAKRASEVLHVMADGKPRIDEEIHAAMLARGYRVEMSSARHGRKVLQDRGIVVKTGVLRRTRYDRDSIEWVILSPFALATNRQGESTEPARAKRRLPTKAKAKAWSDALSVVMSGSLDLLFDQNLIELRNWLES